MSVPLPLERLRAELDRRAATVYLLTVSEGGRPHCVAVRCAWVDGEIEVRTGSTSARNATARPAVTLLAPPLAHGAAEGQGPGSDDGAAPGAGRDTSGHSLIVDGDVISGPVAAEGASAVRIRPVHAVFHRPASGPDATAAHDCVPVLHHSRPAAGPDR